ncbi:MAG: UDP-3-O-acyl-N-acetylglucosamine deacetylase [Candidatus Omnitrophota bacterium]
MKKERYSPLITARQKTIAKEFVFAGKALQTGRDVEVICRPGGIDTGISFKRSDLDGSPLIRLSDAVFSSGQMRRTTIGSGPFAVQTVEHFLAALWGMGIDNILVEISGEELPALGGNALGFLEKMKQAGTVEQQADKKYIKVLETERVEENGASLTVFPADEFSISYFIDYDVKSIGRETFEITPDEFSFEKEIAPARTFCLRREAEELLRSGIGQGANFENTLVMDDTGPLGTTLRYKNEPVRHKVLDLIGDLYMMGRPVIGRFIAEKSGHKVNSMMARKLYEKYMLNI